MTFKKCIWGIYGFSLKQMKYLSVLKNTVYMYMCDFYDQAYHIPLIIILFSAEDSIFCM